MRRDVGGLVVVVARAACLLYTLAADYFLAVFVANHVRREERQGDEAKLTTLKSQTILHIEKNKN